MIDPIDGTTNFIRGIPSYAISIALMRDGEILVGVVYDLSLNELYAAAKGSGAFCNGKPVHVTQTDRLEEFIISTSFPAADILAREKVLKEIEKHETKFNSLRIWNCASLGVVNVACGRVDAHIEIGIHLWDFAAGALIVQEAGGTFTDIDGMPFHAYQKHVLVSNGKLHAGFVHTLLSDGFASSPNT